MERDKRSLTVSRKTKEAVLIIDRETGETICEVEVGRLRAGSGRLTFKADDRFTILREEIAPRVPGPTAYVGSSGTQW